MYIVKSICARLKKLNMILMSHHSNPVSGGLFATRITFILFFTISETIVGLLYSRI